MGEAHINLKKDINYMTKLKKILLIFALLLVIIPCTAIFAACGTQPTTETYTVTFVDWNDSVIGSQKIEEGTQVTAPANPTRTGYEFAGWDIDFSNVTSDITVKATYTINTYTVTFVDYDGITVLDTQTVNHGANAIAPTDPTREDYIFTGWDKTFTNITANVTITAVY